MKSLLMVGGILGFVSGGAISALREQPLLSCLGHGCVAALVAGLLLPWWNCAWGLTDDAASDEQNSPNPSNS